MASEGSTDVADGCIKGPHFLFMIDYYKSRNLPFGTCITSPTFTAGGYDWALHFYPHGDMSDKKWPAVFLYLKSQIVKDITAKYSLNLLDKRGRFSGFLQVDKFTSSKKFTGYTKFCNELFLKRYCCVDSTIAISCAIEVVTQTIDVHTDICGLCEHIGNLWEKAELFDVIFEVDGESIPAHRLILAARSPVFRAELYGFMAEAKMARIKIEEMKAEVFKPLLHFIYTDHILTDDSSDHDQTLSVELFQGLLEAADRYAIRELRLLCEEQLAESFSIDTVATTLLLADRHSCAGLKGKCLDFASSPENFLLIALTNGYLQIIQEAPTLCAELSEKVKASAKNFAKK